MRGDGKCEGVTGSSVKFVRTQSRRHKSIFYKTRRGINGPTSVRRSICTHVISAPVLLLYEWLHFVQAENYRVKWAEEARNF